MKRFGLIGFPLTHSFSKRYFAEKFAKENIVDAQYDNYEMHDARSLLQVISEHPDLQGVNVTIPHKESVLSLLNEIDEAAQRIGAVNVIRIRNGKLKGFNSDYYGFKNSLVSFLNGQKVKALVLGTGGAAKAVVTALEDLSIEYSFVSRQSGGTHYSYDDLDEEIIRDHHLIINTTPLGMFPKTDACPDLPYEALTPNHFLYDLIYNPEETLFMKKGLEKEAKVKNGLEMLVLQAEKAWEIWNDVKI